MKILSNRFNNRPGNCCKFYVDIFIHFNIIKLVINEAILGVPTHL